LIKLHLKLDLDKYYAARFPKVEVVTEEGELTKDKDKKKDDKKPAKGGKDAKGPEAPIEKVYRIEEREVEMSLDLVEPASLEYICDVIKRLVQTSPKMLLLHISFGFPVGAPQKDFS
jgi:hypothetical protein